MRIGRTVPPAAAPISCSDVAWAIAGMFTPRRSTRAREEEFRRYFGVPHVFLVSSGTAALTLALRGLKASSSRTRVVVPAFTCFSVPAAVLEAGLTPVICDIDPETFDFDHASLERALTEDTLCVVAQHLFGIPSNIERIRALCRRRGILVVEDAAQAMGVECNGRSLGTLGDVGILSFGRGKHITAGSGGIVVTRSPQIADAISREWDSLTPPSAFKVVKELLQLVLMAIFIRPTLYWIPAALPFLRLGETVFPAHVALGHLSGMQAGALRHWTSRLRQSNRAHSEHAADLSRRLSLTPPCGPSHPYLRLPILAATPAERDRMHSLSQQRGLGLGLAYPTPINDIPEIKSLFDGQQCPGARTVAARMLTLPTHHWLSRTDTQAIAACSAAHMTVARPAALWRRAS